MKKRLFEFSVSKKEQVTEKQPSKDEEGKDITIERQVEKDVPYKFFLSKPSRSLKDKASLFYSSQMGKAMKLGLLSNALISKMYDDSGGAFSDDEQRKLKKLYKEREALSKDVQGIVAVAGKERSKEQKDELAEGLADLTLIERDIRRAELQKMSIFDNSCETYAQNKTIVYYSLCMAFNEDGTPFFPGEDHEERLDYLESLEEEEDPFKIEVKNKFFYYISLWVYGNFENKEQFEEFVKTVDVNKELKDAQEEEDNPESETAEDTSLEPEAPAETVA